MYNILINNLSIINTSLIRQVNHYRYQNKEKTFTFEGIQTNEAVTKLLMQELSQNGNEQLDHIISLATTGVTGSYLSFKEENMTASEILASYLQISESEIARQTHYDFYKKGLELFAEKQQVFMPEATPIPVPNPSDLNAEEIHKAVIDLAEKILQLYSIHNNECRLFMDYTGGDRSASTIMIALTKMLENRGIRISRILAVHFHGNSSPENPCEIKEKISVNYIFDFISGIHEFTQYGNAKTLMSYFQEENDNATDINVYHALSTQAKNVLAAITNVSNQIQMCRSAAIPKSIQQLHSAIQAYHKSEHKENALFDYLIKDIENSYQEIFKTDAPSALAAIRWCLNKNLIQQAVTMYAELLPSEFVHQKIFYYFREDWDWNWESTENDYNRRFFKNPVQNHWFYGTTNKKRILKESNEKKLRGHKDFSLEYAYINYYLWDNCNYFARKNTDTYDERLPEHYMKRSERLVTYMINSKTNVKWLSKYLQYKQNVEAEQLYHALGNYMLFKKLIRHSLNHASSKEINLEAIKNYMHWKDKSAVFIHVSTDCENQELTVDLLTAILNDLLEQLEDLGMR